jgi:hypothetical protein
MNRKTRFRTRPDYTFWPTHVVMIFRFWTIHVKASSFSISLIVHTFHIFSCYFIHLLINVFIILLFFINATFLWDTDVCVQLFLFSSVFPVFHALIQRFFPSSDPIKFGAVNLLQIIFCRWSNKRNTDGKVRIDAKDWSSKRGKGRIRLLEQK